MESHNFLCVCMGNTCRSPMMEAFLRLLMIEFSLEGEAESAGILESASGSPVNDHSVVEMLLRDISISTHESRYIGNIKDLGRFGMILCVDTSVALEVSRLFPDFKGEIHVLNEENGGIVNPYGLAQVEYAHCADVIDRAMRAFLLQRLHAHGS